MEEYKTYLKYSILAIIVITAVAGAIAANMMAVEPKLSKEEQ
jgi:hypothetical protein